MTRCVVAQLLVIQTVTYRKKTTAPAPSTQLGAGAAANAGAAGAGAPAAWAWPTPSTAVPARATAAIPEANLRTFSSHLFTDNPLAATLAEASGPLNAGSGNSKTRPSPASPQPSRLPSTELEVLRSP
ncbi:hypothetical protein F2B00_12540 [Streptomyces parvus]|nr:hypothetical protein F2B00_12540 [Streptomyces parvus]